MTCIRCGDQLDRNRGARAALCGTCSRYHTRTGTNRPDHLIARQTQRDIDRARHTR